ncbi:hypothetical protein [Microcoleus sp. EPA2]|uniref:hypothetical protein n=1 Tax=Microcoleus sp. EPA2 TaxID=2841654 RepID=UPI00312BB63A
MNSQKYKIQALIAEIDEVLSKPVPRLPWTGSIDLVHQRQLLERVRTYLVSPDSKLMVPDKPANSPQMRPQPVPVPKVPLATNQHSATEQILQAVTGEISHLREKLTGPLQEDIEALRQQQQALVQEIKELEVRRQQQQSLAQQQAHQQQIISEFLQAVTSRLQETRLGNLSPNPQATTSDSLDVHPQAPGESSVPTSAPRLEQLQEFETEADRLLMRLDSTMHIVFEALQGNLESYQASLSQGLEKMHGLGQQSEMMFTALVSHLAQELGREASSYLQQPIDLSTLGNATFTSEILPNTSQTELATETPRAEMAIAHGNSSNQLEEQERLPYAGTEISSQFGQLKRDRTSVAISLPDLEENLFGSGPQVDPPTTPFPGAESETPSAKTDEEVEDVYANLFLEAEVAELDLENFVIENTATATESKLIPSENQPVVASESPLDSQGLDLFGELEFEDSSASHQPVVVSESPLDSQGLDLFGELEAEDSSASNQPVVASESPLDSQGLDLFGELEAEDSSASNQPVVASESSLDSQGLDLFGELEAEDSSASNQPVVASESSLDSQGLDLFGELEFDDYSASEQPVVASESSLDSQGLDLFGELEAEDSSESNSSFSGNDEALNATNELFQNLLHEDESEAGFLVGENSEELTLETPDLGRQQVTTPPLSPEPTIPKVEPQRLGNQGANPATASSQSELSATEVGTQTRSTSELPGALRSRGESSSTSQSAPTNLEPSNLAPEDFYIQASPDENLLPIESSQEEDVDRSLNLDSDILEQLESDLYSLEGLENTNPRPSPDSTTVKSGFFADAEANTANPFPEMAEAELGTLEDLFPDILQESSEDEIFTLEDDLDSDLLTQEEAANVSLDDILASLTPTQENPINSANPSPETAAETTRMRSNSPKSQKKNLISIESNKAASVPNSVASSIAPSFPESPTPAPPRPNSHWYLSIDFGTCGLSAALVDRQKHQLYPIYWEKQPSETSSNDAYEPVTTCRIPSVAVLAKTATEGLGQQIRVNSVGDRPQTLLVGELLLQNFKLPLKVGIPYLRETGVVYEPLLQLSQEQAISIALPLNGLRALLTTLNPRLQGQNDDLSMPNFICRASGLEKETLDRALQNLRGVILGTPAHWSDAYRFNLREAVLGAGLVAEGEQIFVVEDAIATLLSAVTPVTNAYFGQSETGESIAEENPGSNRQLVLHASSFSGGTLIINAGATTVELGLVDLPENSQHLSYTDFACQSFAFAGNAFDQDIICQLLAKNETFGMSLDLPRPGHPDLPSRYQLQQRLQSSTFGLQLLEAARHLKVILQHQESFVLDIGEQRWNVRRKDLESQVLVPFVQQLNRELNVLLSRVGISPVGINQAICAGGMGAWPAIARWLRQKLPNAIVVQYPEFEDVKISRVACGLASVAVYPQILDASRHQYGNFFILWELMQVLGEAAMRFEQILQLLERRGVNTRTCESRILGILAGNWTAGLLPDRTDLMLLAPDSQQNPDWEAIGAAPLFLQEGDRTYSLNIPQASIVREYLTKLASSSQQKILEPLTIAWGVRTNT